MCRRRATASAVALAERELPVDSRRRPSSRARAASRWCSSVGMMSRMRSLPSMRRAAGLLEEERHRVRLVEQAELAALALRVGGVREDAALEQRAVRVGDERADVARAVRRLERLAAVGRRCRPSRLDPARPLLDLGRPARVVALVDRVAVAARAGTRMSGCERKNSPIVGSSVKPCTPWPVDMTKIVDEP